MDNRDSIDRSSSEIVSGDPFTNVSLFNGGTELQPTVVVPPESHIPPLINDTLSTIDGILKSDVRLPCI